MYGCHPASRMSDRWKSVRPCRQSRAHRSGSTRLNLLLFLCSQMDDLKEKKERFRCILPTALQEGFGFRRFLKNSTLPPGTGISLPHPHVWILLRLLHALKIMQSPSRTDGLKLGLDRYNECIFPTSTGHAILIAWQSHNVIKVANS